MNPGDLIRYKPHGYSDWIIGVWLSGRYSKWSNVYMFHKILAPDGVVEMILRDTEYEVIG